MLSPRVRIFLLVWITAGVVPCLPALGQHHRLLPVDDGAYVFITRLQRRGHLLELHPAALPYTQGAVLEALAELDPDALPPVEAAWAARLRAALATPETNRPLLAAGAEAGLTTIDTDRQDPLRPTDMGDPTLTAGPLRLFPEAAVTGLLEHGRFIARLGLRFDLYYRDDPDALDAANRLITRNESYLGYDGRLVAAYFGRFQNHWATYGDAATLVSANPVPYDRLYLRIGGERLALRSILGELDSITADGRFTGAAGADSVRGSERRFLAAHRFDWRPSRNVALSFMEANLYSGANAGLSPRYLNPLQVHAFLVDNPPKNEENNGLLAGLLWFYHRRFTLQGQLMLDDFDILNQTGEPPSLALMGSLHYAGILPAADVGARLSIVSARAYNTHQAEGRYLYLLRGLATQFSDYVHAAVFADLYSRRVPGLVVTPQVALLLQGEADLRQPYPTGEVPFVLSGREERTLRFGAELFYQPDPRFWLRLDAGVNTTDHAGHREGARRTRFVGMLSFGTRLSLAQPFRLDFP